MMQSRHTHSSKPSVSFAFPAEFPLLSSSPTKSPPVTNSRSRMGVISTTLPLSRGWLNRSSSSSSSSFTPYAPPKTTRISEPKLDAGYRSGALGAGATIVRTPQDALAGTSAAIAVPDIPFIGISSKAGEDKCAMLSPKRNATPSSPPLPPIPDFKDDETAELSEEHEDTYSDTPSISSTPPACLPRSVPPAPLETMADPTPPVRPSLKTISPLTSAYLPPVPSLPTNLALSPPQMPFDPILISPPPTACVNPDRVIVSLETSTATFRTTLSTLTSRPSLLATYLKSLITSRRSDSDELSVYSDQSDDNSAFHSMFHRHLTSSGVISQTSTSMHIFLDRPSAPYAHILTYLRTPPSTLEQPAVLPRPARLSSSSSARLEALLELRDETRYLDLAELYKLCLDEIRLRHVNALGLHAHSRGPSSVSITSSRSLGALQEIVKCKLEDQQGHALAMHRQGSLKRQQTFEQRARSKDSGIGTASPGSFKAVPNNDVQMAVSAPISIPGLQQRVAMRARGRSETRRTDIDPPAGANEWI